jgi:hypothetical protein
MKYDERGLRQFKHELDFRIAPTSYEWSETQRLVAIFERDYNTHMVPHSLGEYAYVYHEDENTALAVCEYADFPEMRERDILMAFPDRGRMGKIALYRLLNHVIETTPKGWQAAGFVATNHTPMRKMIEAAGFVPKLVMYTKEVM